MFRCGLIRAYSQMY